MMRIILGKSRHTLAKSSPWQHRQHYCFSTERKKVALIMGVANQRSIAWACVESFLRKDFDCIITYYDPSAADAGKYASKIEKLASAAAAIGSISSNGDAKARILGCIPCNVETDLPVLFRQRLPSLLLVRRDERKIDAVVHSIAYASEMNRPLLQTSRSAYLHAQHVSAYSFLETARECVDGNLLAEEGAALTTLTYLGAIRAVPHYGSMGPAKAALESLVRGLAFELGSQHWRVNAVSAGPVPTVSARSIPHFRSMQQHAAETAPLRRNVTTEEVAETVTWISTPAASGITGQIIYVDAGYSSIVTTGTVG